MLHENYKNLLQLYIYNEIEEDEKRSLEVHLESCRACREELQSLKQLYRALTEAIPPVNTDELLNEARQELKSLIHRRRKAPLFYGTIQWLESFFAENYKIALGGAFSLLVGFFIGYLFFTSQKPLMSAYPGNLTDLDKLDNSAIKFSSIRIDNRLADNGEIEFKFDALKPMSYKGKITDRISQQLLASALVTADNPGTRIRTVNAIAQNQDKNYMFEDKIKTSLIEALKLDKNAGVRREALNVLIKFPIDEQILDAVLFVLANDENSGMRVAAINSLVNIDSQGTVIDDQIKNLINERAEVDDNDFIRIRAASLLRR